MRPDLALGQQTFLLALAAAPTERPLAERARWAAAKVGPETTRLYILALGGYAAPGWPIAKLHTEAELMTLVDRARDAGGGTQTCPRCRRTTFATVNGQVHGDDDTPICVVLP